jgi:selenide,water dikinase
MTDEQRHQPITRMATCGGCAAKVGAGDLRDILRRASGPAPPRPARLLVGTETGDDAAVYAFSDEAALVVTTDFITPICDDPFLYGQVAAANALSDVYAMGGRPLVALAVCAFPDELEPDIAAAICAGGAAKAAEAGAVVAGGHTVRNPQLLYGLAVTGHVPPRSIVRNAGARPGDRLVLTKPLGTGVTINGYREGKLGEADLLATCKAMSALNARAAALMVAHGAHAATDVTGFGIAGHALGMARASNVRLRLLTERFPVYPNALSLIEAGVSGKGARLNRKTYEPEIEFGRQVLTPRDLLVFDPQTSGGLLVALPAERAADFLEAVREAGHPAATIVGEVADGVETHAAPLLQIS